MPGRRWVDGAVELTEQQRAFIEFLVDPSKTKGSQEQFAKTLGVNSSTLSKWKKDGPFRDAWDARLRELNVEPDRVQRVIDAMYAAACGGDTKAATLWLQYIDRFTPKTVSVVEQRTAKEMSDDELAAAADNVFFLRQAK